MNAHEVSAQLTRTVLWIDRYYRGREASGTDKLDQEGLVPVHWSALEPHPIDDWSEATARLRDVLDQASTVPDPYERDWLCEQALSLVTLIRWLAGAHLTYEEVVAGTLRIDPTPPTAQTLEQAR